METISDSQDDCYNASSQLTVVTPKQSCPKRRMREWELNTVPITSLSISTPDSKYENFSSQTPLSGIVTQASDSDMEEIDDISNLYGQMAHQSEYKRIRTDVDYLIPTYQQMINNCNKYIQPDNWWKKKSRMQNAIYESQHSQSVLAYKNDLGTTQGFKSTSILHECNICQMSVSSNSAKNSLLSLKNASAPNVLKGCNHDPSKTKQKNSLLSYFNPTKSALSKCSYHNIDRGNSSIVLQSSAHLCSYCDRVSCINCRSTCEQCQSSFCTFCYTVNYESNVERIICFTCQDLTTSESTDMDVS